MDVVDILFHLPEMRCQLADPFIQPADILHHRIHLGLNLAGRLMHAGVAKDGAHRVQQQHQIQVHKLLNIAADVQRWGAEINWN